MNIWVATQNEHKVEEISAILAPIQVKSFLDLKNIPEVDENGSTYFENAMIKAKALHEIVKEPVMADDSGLEVDALDGKPGIHSARFSGSDTNHARNVAKMLEVMKDVPDEKRTARFRCVIAYIDAEGNQAVWKDKEEEGNFLLPFLLLRCGNCKKPCSYDSSYRDDDRIWNPL